MISFERVAPGHSFSDKLRCALRVAESISGFTCCLGSLKISLYQFPSGRLPVLDVAGKRRQCVQHARTIMFRDYAAIQ